MKNPFFWSIQTNFWFKEDRAGRSPEKLGFVILNLTEFAYSGAEGITRSYLVDGYDNNQRADNSRVHIFVRMQHNSADPLFTMSFPPLLTLEKNIEN